MDRFVVCIDFIFLFFIEVIDTVLQTNTHNVSGCINMVKSSLLQDRTTCWSSKMSKPTDLMLGGHEHGL